MKFVYTTILLVIGFSASAEQTIFDGSCVHSNRNIYINQKLDAQTYGGTLAGCIDDMAVDGNGHDIATCHFVFKSKKPRAQGYLLMDFVRRIKGKKVQMTTANGFEKEVDVWEECDPGIFAK